MPERNLFVCFPESDGGHSYLAAREMLNPKSVAHLLFRNTVAESFEAVAAGQATYAVVPAYNSITQWDGATLKALATGGFEIYGQVCMPTSYVLVAHTDYIDDFLQTYTSIKELGDNPSPEEKAKIYTRFLTKIYVGAHADEQYRGRLIRPDLKNSTVELSRNPLRVLEELSRSDQMMQMMKVGRIEKETRGDRSGIYLPTATQVRVVDTVHAPAALVASGLLDAPGDPEGWDQPGSLGEIVALLRKLLVLLNVYSFGAPDLPENTTQYLLIGRRGEATPAKDALKLPATVTTRIMTMVRPMVKKSSSAQWLKPHADLSRLARSHGFVYDRAPISVSTGKTTTFLFEGGKLKDGGLLPSSGGFWSWLFGGTTDSVSKSTLRKSIEKKPLNDKPSDGRFFLGEYPSWCYGLSHKPGEARCCDEPHAADVAAPAVSDVNVTPILQFLLATLVGLTLLGLLGTFLYCPITGACSSSFKPDMHVIPPPVTAPGDQQPPSNSGSATAPSTPNAYPGVTPVQPQAEPKPPVTTTPAYPGVTPAYPGVTPPSSSPATDKPSLQPAQPKVTTPRQVPFFHIAFNTGKANLTPDMMNVLTSAAAQAIQLQYPTKVRAVTLGPNEGEEVWQRRRRALEDELVRLGIARNRITHEQTRSLLIIHIKPEARPATAPGKRASLDVDAVDDPMMGDY